jgi:hypothetical protein
MNNERSDRLMTGLSGFSKAVALFRVVVTAVFLCVGPLWAIAAWLGAATLLLASLGLLMDTLSLRPALETWVSRRTAKDLTWASGLLHVEHFEERVAPCSDVREVVVNPQNGDEAIAGSWAEDLHITRDGGQSWTALGLRGVEVRTLGVDRFDKGVWTRRLPE